MSGLRDELQTIYDKYGQLTAEMVVEEARPIGHPLHDRVFDRGRKEAADAWYLHRADFGQFKIDATRDVEVIE